MGQVSWDIGFQPIGPHVFFGEPALAAKDAYPWWFCHNVPMSDPEHENDSYSDQEIARRRDKALTRALRMPPKPHKPRKEKVRKAQRQAKPE